MKKIMIVLCAVSFCMTAAAQKTPAGGKKPGGGGMMTDHKKNTAWVAVDSATAMKKMMEAGTPGKQHEMLAKGDGEWTAETTMWMSPGAPPIVAQSKAVNKMILGGHYQQTNFSGDFMGMPFEGISTVGYDNTKKKWFSTWIDNMGTGLMTMEGDWNEADNALHLKGKMICPTNGIECEEREVFKIVDNDTHIMEMYGPDPKTGKEYKSMMIKFTRNK